MSDAVRIITEQVRVRVRREGVDLAADGARRELRARRGAAVQRAGARRLAAAAADEGQAAGKRSPPSPGSAPCSRSSTTRASRRSGSMLTDQGLHRSNGRARADTSDARRSGRCATSSSGCCRPSGRRVDLCVAVRRRVAARRVAAARRDSGYHAALGRQRAQVHGRIRDLNQLVALGSLSQSRRGVPADVRAGRAEHPGVRCDADRQDDDARRPCCLPPGTTSAS